MGTVVAQKLITAHRLISDQVSKEQVTTILGELERLLERGKDGAVVEFGCYKGTTSLFIRRLLDAYGDSREFHVYDSFEGLPAKTIADQSRAGEQFVAGALAVSKKEFMREFQRAGLAPPTVHKGWFKDLPSEAVPNKILFAFLDGDFYESIRDSLELILPHMQHGGVVIIDDYAREALPGAARAVHEHFSPDRVKTVHNLGVITV